MKVEKRTITSSIECLLDVILKVLIMQEESKRTIVKENRKVVD